MSEKVKIALFSGGRGTSNFTRALVSHPQFELKLLVNGYDDGLSTGRIRRFVPGILGPSDFRKNMSYLFDESQSHKKALREIFEYRLPTTISSLENRKDIDDLVRLGTCSNKKLNEYFLNLSVRDSRWLVELLSCFIKYESETGGDFDYNDCSIGNIIFASEYLRCGKNFNQSLINISLQIQTSATVLNVTQGEDLILCAIKRDGSFLEDEAQIVGPGSAPIEEIFLLPKYLTESEKLELSKCGDIKSKIFFLNSRSVKPKISDPAIQALSEADIIIYGPGTQHSSLFPSYLTDQCAEVIKSNTEAFKVFIGNINSDHDIKGEDVKSILDKWKFYISRKGESSELVTDLLTHIFLHSGFSLDKADQIDLGFKDVNVKQIDWEMEKGQHSLSLISDELISLAQTKKNEKLAEQQHLVSIIVPVLNERSTIKTVIDQLSSLSLKDLKLEKEIIVVDGGSSDGGIDLIKDKPQIKICIPEKRIGRGRAYREGLRQAKGNIVVFFPSDNEYDVKDIKKVLLPFLTEQAKCVIGSRATKSTNMSKTILSIYEGNRFSYLSSKYGGILLSFLMLICHNRYITDCLSSVKAFRRKSITNPGYTADGFDFDIEMIIDIIRQQEFIYEVPVNFSPRKKSEGKKITFYDGILFMWRIVSGG